MMSLKKFDWKIWFDDKEKLEDSFSFYLKKGAITKETETESLSKSHMNKADSNLDFINFLEKSKRFYDWIIVGCYYTIYHASLSLLSKKGFSSKNHLASLCALIKFYYFNEKKISLTKEDIELVSKSSLEKQEIAYFAEAKEKRETASYIPSQSFTKSEAEDLRKKTIQFVNKCKEILENI